MTKITSDFYKYIYLNQLFRTLLYKLKSMPEKINKLKCYYCRSHLRNNVCKFNNFVPCKRPA